jgi:hypothetical protein
MTKVRPGWAPNMEQRAAPDGRQVKCLTSDAGHVWIHYYDELPPPVRRRLAEGNFNICPACLWGEAQKVAAAQRLRQPTVRIYFAVIASIEQQLSSRNDP